MIPFVKCSMQNSIDENDEIAKLNIEENHEVDKRKPLTYMGILCDYTVQLC